MSVTQLRFLSARLSVNAPGRARHRLVGRRLDQVISRLNRKRDIAELCEKARKAYMLGEVKFLPGTGFLGAPKNYDPINDTILIWRDEEHLRENLSRQ